MEVKKIILVFMVFLVVGFSYSQNENTEIIDADDYSIKEIKPEFSNYFKTEEQKKEIKQLREFLRKKEDLFKELSTNFEDFFDYSKTIARLDDKIVKLTDIIKNRKENEVVEIDPYFFEISMGAWIGDADEGAITKIVKYTVSQINDKINNLKNEKTAYEKLNQNRIILKKNIKYVNVDILDCRNQIDNTSEIENRNQEFRKTISIYFTILIGILLVIFFLIVYLKSDNTLSKELLSGYGLQFITLFVLIIAVILFGILGILQSSELSAILSGISGYILGKGIQEKKTVDLTQLTNPANQSNVNQML